MPYENISELPPSFNKLPTEAKQIALEALNAVLDEGGTDIEAVKQAWVAVKKSYKKGDNGWVVKNTEPELQTVDIDELEILAVGTWNGSPAPKTYTKDDLQNMVTAFGELSGTTNYEPPVKLGHAVNQKLLQEDGYPAAGWVKSLKVKGDKLIASLSQVPQKIGDIIKAGGWKKVSSEVSFNYKEGDTVYPSVLKAVSLLGGDIPAVKTIADIRAQYAEDDQPDIVIYERQFLEESIQRRVEQVREAFYAIKRPAGEVPQRAAFENWYIKDVLDDAVIVETDAGLVKIPYDIDTKNGVTFDFDTQSKVEIVYETRLEEVDSMKGLRELLGLKEDATEEVVLATIQELKDTPESVSLAEHVRVSAQVEGLTQKLAERDRDEAVGMAIRQGKILPAQKEWAEEYALSAPDSFAKFVTGAPVVVSLKELGGDGGDAVEVSAKELEVAKYFGDVTEQDLMEFHKSGKEGVA